MPRSLGGIILVPLFALLSACAPSPRAPTPTSEPSIPSPTVPAVSVPAPLPTLTTSVPTSTAKSERQATSFPNPKAFAWTAVVAGLESPVDIQFPDDGTGRMFVVEQRGRIRIVQADQLLPTPFLDITDRVDSGGDEQGLLGLAFHPHFSENGLFFVSYTDNQRHDVIARFLISADPNQADAGSGKILISVDDPFPNHNGGVLAFGPDGYLYAGLGDGGGANDPFGNGQSTDTLLGKILRLDVDRGDPYAVPGGNPFVHSGGRPEIWAYGLRNPWRLSFDRATGDLYIADVGQDTWEEVDFLPAGSTGGTNFGWNYREGNHPFKGEPPASLHLTYPVAEYSHTEGSCAVTGGYVYRGAMPEWQGIYLYGDYCSGKIWGLRHDASAQGDQQWTSALLFESNAHITTFGQDQAEETYFADREGTIYRLTRAP
jgi:glucose/arabinose dehydrogenase